MPENAHIRQKLDLIAATRPVEIEPKSNLYFIHPASRALVPFLHAVGFSPNLVSAAGALAAGLAALAFLFLPWPYNALAGSLLLILRHILDGADGLLARATGQASAWGDMVDGICDAVALFFVHGALLILVLRELDTAYAVGLVALGLASYILQVNAYEGRRRTYLRRSRGSSIVTKDSAESRPSDNPSKGPIRWLAERVYEIYFVNRRYEARDLEQEMERRSAGNEEALNRARKIYVRFKAPFIRRFGLLGENLKTAATCVAVFAGGAMYYYLFLIVVLNAFLAGLLFWQRTLDRKIVGELRSRQ